MADADQVVLDTIGSVAVEPTDIPLPQPSYDGRAVEADAPLSVAEQLHSDTVTIIVQEDQDSVVTS